MRKLPLVLIAVLIFIACETKPQRYFADSAEIETLKSGINAYETGDWAIWKSHFSDTAKIFVNSTKPLTPEKRLEALKTMTNALSDYGFDHDKEHIEMVLDKEDETWVYYWATHHGTFSANNKKLAIPVHLALQFVDGKIVEEHIYFDGTKMNAVFEEIAAAKTKSEAEVTEE